MGAVVVAAAAVVAVKETAVDIAVSAAATASSPLRIRLSGRSARSWGTATHFMASKELRMGMPVKWQCSPDLPEERTISSEEAGTESVKVLCTPCASVYSLSMDLTRA